MYDKASVIHLVYQYARNNVKDFPQNKLNACLNIDVPIVAFRTPSDYIGFDFAEDVYKYSNTKLIQDKMKNNYSEDLDRLNSFIMDRLYENRTCMNLLYGVNHVKLYITVPMRFYRYNKGIYFFCEVSNRVSCVEFSADVS